MTLLVQLFALLVTAATPPTSANFPVSAKGDMSTVVLMSFRVLSKEDAGTCCPGAPTAVEAVLLIDPVGEPMDPTFSPSVALVINGDSYEPAVVNEGSMKPVIVVRDVDDIFSERPELRSLVPGGFEPHLALVITFPAKSFPERADVELKLKAGYHRKLEPLSLRLTVPTTPGG